MFLHTLFRLGTIFVVMLGDTCALSQLLTARNALSPSLTAADAPPTRSDVSVQASWLNSSNRVLLPRFAVGLHELAASICPFRQSRVGTREGGAVYVSLGDEKGETEDT